MMFYFYGVDDKQKVECVIIFKTLAILELQIFNIILRCSLFAQLNIIKNLFGTWQKYQSFINLFNGKRKKLRNCEIIFFTLTITWNSCDFSYELMKIKFIWKLYKPIKLGKFVMSLKDFISHKLYLDLDLFYFYSVFHKKI
jgi:hypothetical protein